MGRGPRWAVAATALWLALSLAACTPQEQSLSPRQLSAQTPWDLGPDSIDVREYPREMREAYDVFRERCSLCHTLARPVNFPAREWGDWHRYVNAMHVRSRSVLLSPLNERKIVDFLVFDAKRRKGGDGFRQQVEELTMLYERVKRERAGRP